jgi:hypothetical protein
MMDGLCAGYVQSSRFVSAFSGAFFSWMHVEILDSSPLLLFLIYPHLECKFSAYFQKPTCSRGKFLHIKNEHTQDQ